MTTKKNEKAKAISIIEKWIRWIFYVELVIMVMVVITLLQKGGEWGAALYMVPPLSGLIGLLSIPIVTKLKQVSNIVRIAIALNWVVIILVYLYFAKTGHF